jgi:uncharacterized protein (TIGR00725 family)
MRKMKKELRSKYYISVCCAACPPENELKLAYEVGKEIALSGAILVCGGLGGSMEEVCKGAKENGGMTIGIIPSMDKNTANPWVDIIIPTGLGHARNNLVVSTGDGVIGVGGSWGTLSELAIAMKMGKRVVVLESWEASAKEHPGDVFRKAKDARDAVRIVSEE